MEETKKTGELGGEDIQFVHETSEKLIQNALDAFGKIDILVNNAGITRDNLMMRMSETEWQSVIDVNLNKRFRWKIFFYIRTAVVYGKRKCKIAIRYFFSPII